MNFPSWHVLVDPSCRADIPLEASGSRGVKAGGVWFKQRDAIDPCCQAPQVMRSPDSQKKGIFSEVPNWRLPIITRSFPNGRRKWSCSYQKQWFEAASSLLLVQMSLGKPYAYQVPGWQWSDYLNTNTYLLDNHILATQLSLLCIYHEPMFLCDSIS